MSKFVEQFEKNVKSQKEGPSAEDIKFAEEDKRDALETRIKSLKKQRRSLITDIDKACKPSTGDEEFADIVENNMIKDKTLAARVEVLEAALKEYFA